MALCLGYPLGAQFLRLLPFPPPKNQPAASELGLELSFYSIFSFFFLPSTFPFGMCKLNFPFLEREFLLRNKGNTGLPGSGRLHTPTQGPRFSPWLGN